MATHQIICQMDSGNQLRLLTASLPAALWQSATATHRIPAGCTLAISYSYPLAPCQMHSGNQLQLLTGFLPDALWQSATATHRFSAKNNTSYRLWLLTKPSIRCTLATGYPPHLCQMHSGYQLRLLTASSHRTTARFNQATGYDSPPDFLPRQHRLPSAATHHISARCTQAISLPNQPQAIPKIHRIPPMASPQSSSSFSTLRKAFWGISTLPIWRMPSFCFSSSFFFRVMSPP